MKNDKIRLYVTVALIVLLCIYTAYYVPMFFGLVGLENIQNGVVGLKYDAGWNMVLYPLTFAYLLLTASLLPTTIFTQKAMNKQAAAKSVVPLIAISIAGVAVGAIISLAANTVVWCVLLITGTMKTVLVFSGYVATIIAVAALVLNIINYRSYKSKLSGGKSANGEKLPEGNAVV